MKNWFFIILTLSVACQDPEEPDFLDPGYGYYPLNLGDERLYEVQRIDYFLEVDSATNEVTTVADTSEFLVREYMASTTEGTNGTTIFIEHSYSKPDTSFFWPLQPDSLYQVINTEIYLNKNRNNRIFSELRFPLEHSASWNGNAFNDLGIEVFIVDSFNFSMNLNGIEFEKCLRITKSDIENLIEKNQRWEIYAEGVGSVQKSFEVLQYKQNISSDIQGLQRIERGFFEKWTYYESD